MSRWINKLIAVLALSQIADIALADIGGCTNSPENPTVILGLLGSAAAGLPWIRAQIATRRRKRGV